MSLSRAQSSHPASTHASNLAPNNNPTHDLSRSVLDTRAESVLLSRSERCDGSREKPTSSFPSRPSMNCQAKASENAKPVDNCTASVEQRSNDSFEDETDQEGWYQIRGITKEKKKGQRVVSYLVTWANNPNTGKPYKPTWVPACDVNERAISQWRLSKAEKKHNHNRRTGGRSKKRNSVQGHSSPAQRTATLAHSTPGLQESAYTPRNSLRADSENCPSLIIDEASPITTPGSVGFSRRFFVDLYRKPDFDPSEYISVSESQGSSSQYQSQPISSLESDDQRVLIETQRTIPDSQGDSLYTSGPSQQLSQPPNTEIPDSQKDSSLENLISQQTQAAVVEIIADRPSQYIPSRQPEISQVPDNEALICGFDITLFSAESGSGTTSDQPILNPVVRQVSQPIDVKFQPDIGASDPNSTPDAIGESSNPFHPPLLDDVASTGNFDWDRRAFDLSDSGLHSDRGHLNGQQEADVEVPHSGQHAQAHSSSLDLPTIQLDQSSSLVDKIIPDSSFSSALKMEEPPTEEALSQPPPGQNTTLQASDTEPSGAEASLAPPHNPPPTEEQEPIDYAQLLLDSTRELFKDNPARLAMWDRLPNRTMDLPPIEQIAQSSDPLGTILAFNNITEGAEATQTAQESNAASVDQVDQPGGVPGPVAYTESASDAVQEGASTTNLPFDVATDSIPTTVTPSEVSRSIEPDMPRSDLAQSSLFPPPDSISGSADRSMESSPRTQAEVSRSIPRGSAEFNKFVVTLQMPANTRPLYLETMLKYRKHMEAMTDLTHDGETVDGGTLLEIESLFGGLTDLCDYPTSLGDTELRQLSAVDLRKLAMGTNSKLFFVGRFLERLGDFGRKVLIVARSEKLVGYLRAVVGESNPVQVELIQPDKEVDPSLFDIIIAYDSSYPSSLVAASLAASESLRPMVIQLTTTFSIEHFELALPSELRGLDRNNAMVISLVESRKYIANYDGQFVDEIAAIFASQVLEPDPNFAWEPEDVPIHLLDFYGSTQQTQTQAPKAADEAAASRKRPLEETGSEAATKRFRPDDASAAANLDGTVHELIAPLPDKVQVTMTQAELDALSFKNTDLQSQLRTKDETMETMRKQITMLSTQLTSYESMSNGIQKQHFGALGELAKYEKERNEALGKEQAMRTRLEAHDARVAELNSKLAEARMSPSNRDADLESLKEKTSELEKKVKNRESDLEYARNAYQSASDSAASLARENQELRDQVARLEMETSANRVKILQINAENQAAELHRLLAETQSIVKDRENELDRVREELRLKNGRRDTRGSSVPRSPRMSMMSPRPGRGGMSVPGSAGLPVSRGTSPALAGLFDTAGPMPPVPGTQYFSNQAPPNGRYNHLRDF